jgi:hypothetical protein
MSRGFAWMGGLLVIACTSSAGTGSGGSGGGAAAGARAGMAGGAGSGGDVSSGGKPGGSFGQGGGGQAAGGSGGGTVGGSHGSGGGGRGGMGASPGPGGSSQAATGGAPAGAGGQGGARGGDAGGHPGGASTPIAVAVGYGQRRLFSTDGTHWTLLEKTPDGGDDNDLFRGVTYGNGRFVAVGGSSVALTQVSTDGSHWSNGGTGDAWLGGVAWNGSVFVAAGGNGLRVRSTDGGATWAAPAGYQAKHYRAVAFGDGLVVAVGHTYDNSGPGNTNVGVIATTADGLLWTERRAAGETFGSLAYGNGAFVAATTGATVATSTDGMKWVDQTVGTGSGGVCFTGTDFILWRDSGIYRSSDGATWTLVTSKSRAVAGFFKGAYLSFDWPLRVNASPDLISWTQVFAPLGSGLTQLATGFSP